MYGNGDTTGSAVLWPCLARLFIYDHVSINPRQRFSLGIGDRHHRDFAEFLIEWHQIGDIKTPVECGEVRRGLPMRRWEVQIADVEVDDVEAAGSSQDQLQHVVHELVHATFLQAQRASAGRDEPRVRHGIPPREQGDLMSLIDQLCGEVGRSPPVRSRYSIVAERFHIAAQPARSS
jgi:hypothetical protein